jgi:SAM-dependent methyltransferase
MGEAIIDDSKLSAQPHSKGFIAQFNRLGYHTQKIYVCECCGMVLVRPFPTDEEIVRFEAQERGNSIPAERVWSVPAFIADVDTTWSQAVRVPRLNQIIRQYCNYPLRLLDVGAHGGMVSLLVSLPEGSSVDLVQFDTDMAVGNERPHVRQFRGLLSDLGEENYKADVILALHVLEHVDSPRAFLVDIRKLLSDDGICIVEVPYELPDAWSIAANRIFSGNHKSFFAPWSVLEAVRRAGMQAVDFEFMDCHSTGYSDRAPSPGAVLRVTAKKTDTRSPPAYPSGYAFVRSLDRMFGNFAGSLAYLSERPFRLFIYSEHVFPMTRLFSGRPGFRGIYTSNATMLDGDKVQDIFAAQLNPEEVIVTLEWYARDDIKGRFGAAVEVI